MANEKRIKSESRCTRRITNNDLACRSCQFKFDDHIKLGNTSTCEQYVEKPNSVLLGNPCEKYRKEDSNEDSI